MLELSRAGVTPSYYRMGLPPPDAILGVRLKLLVGSVAAGTVASGWALPNLDPSKVLRARRDRLGLSRALIHGRMLGHTSSVAGSVSDSDHPAPTGQSGGTVRSIVLLLVPASYVGPDSHVRLICLPLGHCVRRSRHPTSCPHGRGAADPSQIISN